MSEYSDALHECIDDLRLQVTSLRAERDDLDKMLHQAVEIIDDLNATLPETIWSLMCVPCRHRRDRMCMALSHPVGCDYRCCPALETWRIACTIIEGSSA